MTENTNKQQDDQAGVSVDSSKFWRLPIVSIILGVISIAAALVISYASYVHTQKMDKKHHQYYYLNEARTLAANIAAKPNLTYEELLRSIKYIWDNSEKRPADEYLCIVDKDSNLILHTAFPEAVGNYVGDNPVLECKCETTCKLKDIAKSGREYLGGYVSSSGQIQIAAFAPVPQHGWTIGVLRSQSAFLKEIRSDLYPMVAGLLTVCVVFIPGSLGILTFAFNLAQRKRVRAEKNLLKNMQINQTLLDNFPCVALLIRPHTREVVASNAAGIAAGIVVGHTCYESWAKGSEPCPWCAAQQMWDGCNPQHAEVKIQGNYFDIHWIPIDEDLFMHYAFDITERRKAEQNIYQSEERFRNLAENIKEGFWLHDIKEKKFTYVSPAYEKIFGVSSQEIYKDSFAWLKFIHPEDKPRIRQSFEKEKQGQSFEDTYRIVREDGSIRWVCDRGFPIYDENGQICRIAGIAEDITERKQDEEELENLSKFPSENPNPVLRISKEGKLLHANPASESLLNEWNCSIGKAVPSHWCQAVSQAYSIDRQKTVEIKHLDKILSFMITPVANTDYVNLYARDITERKQIEAELRKSEERFRDFFEKTPIGLHIFGPDQTIIDINDAELEMIGYSREEIIGKKSWQDIIISAQREKFQKHWDDIITKGQVRDIEYTLVHKKGYHIDVILNASSRFNENGNLINTRGSVLNITEQKQAQGKLQKQSHDLGERVKELNCLYGLSELVEKHNSLEKIFQGTVELIPPSWQYPDLTCARIIALGSTFKSKNFRQGKWKQNAEIMVHSRSAGRMEVFYKEKCPEEDEGPFLKEERDLINALAERLGSIIEHKKAEEKEKQHQLEFIHTARLSIMGQMATELAHELNQPLCAIMGRAESSLRVVEATEPKIDDLVDQIEIIVKQTERAAKIVSRIKHFAVKNTSVRSTVYVKEVVREVMDIVGYQIKRDSVKVILNLDDTEPIQADPIQIEQVVLNLIQNGIEALQEIPKTKRKLTISTKKFGSTIEVAVSDAGQGISEEDIDNVFEPFFTTKTEGLGLGLSICRTIIESHGGSLNFRGNSVDGVTFYITLPIDTKTTVNTKTTVAKNGFL